MPTVLRVTCSISGLPAQAALSRFHFIGEPFTPTNAQQAVDAVQAFWVAQQPSMASAQNILVSNACDVIDIVTGDQVDVVTAASARSVNGSSAGDPLPLQTQFHVCWKTDSFDGGRRLRGGTYIPGITESDSTTGNPSSSVQTRALSGAAGLIAAAGPDFAVYSRTHLHAANVQSASAPLRWTVLRSRR